MGQVNEAQINNERRKFNGTRENGLKLTKINGEMRNYENEVNYLEFEV